MVCGKRAGFVSVNRAQARMMSLQTSTSSARFRVPMAAARARVRAHKLHACGNWDGLDARLANVSPDPYSSVRRNIIRALQYWCRAKRWVKKPRIKP